MAGEEEERTLPEVSGWEPLRPDPSKALPLTSHSSGLSLARASSFSSVLPSAMTHVTLKGEVHLTGSSPSRDHVIHLSPCIS